MSDSVSPSLPLQLDEVDGYKMNKNIVDAIKQNVKMLLLTIPGERVMDPEFGVGLKTFLFEFNDPSTYSSIRARIVQQVSKYLPFIEIEELDIDKPNDLTPDSENSVKVIFTYRIIPTDDIDSIVMDF